MVVGQRRTCARISSQSSGVPGDFEMVQMADGRLAHVLLPALCQLRRGNMSSSTPSR
jgi:hypothetical protein